MPRPTSSQTVLPRHRLAVIRVLFWLVIVGAVAYNVQKSIQLFQLFHGSPPLGVLIIEGFLLAVVLAGAVLGGWFEIQLARLPGDRASRSLYRAIERIAVTLADGDELIDHGPDGTPQAHLTCMRDKATLGFFRVAAADIDTPLWEGERGFTAADLIRLLPKVGAVKIRRVGALSQRDADGRIHHLPNPERAEGWRTLAFWARTGASMASHQELLELLAQLQRASVIDA